MENDNLSERDECGIEFEKDGLHIRGRCADEIRDALSTIYEYSKMAGVEISACGCIDTETGLLDEMIIDKIGDSTSVGISEYRLCPDNKRQISFHTHPTSGIARFSRADSKLIADRMNKDVDDGHCVVGDEETRCLFHTREVYRSSPRLNSKDLED